MQHKTTPLIGLSKQESKQIGQTLTRCNGGILIFPVRDGERMAPTLVPEPQPGQTKLNNFDQLSLRFQAMGCNQIVKVGKDGKSIVINLK